MATPTKATENALAPHFILTRLCAHVLASPYSTLLRLSQSARVIVKIYPHIYPLWGIAFASILGYNDSVEVLLISAPQILIITECCHV